MKILFITGGSEYGGVQKHLMDMIHRCPDPRIEIQLCCLGPDFYSERLNELPNRRLQIECDDGPENIWQWYRLLRRSRPDVVVFVRFWRLSYPRYVALIAWLARIPRRFSIFHTLPSQVMPAEGWSMRSIMERLNRRFTLARAKACGAFYSGNICVSEAIRTAWVAKCGFVPSKMITVHNGIAVSAFEKDEHRASELRAKLGIGAEEFVLVSTSRLSYEKGINVLISAMAKVKEDGVRCKCVLVGDGPLRPGLEEQARNLGLNGNVIFAGFQEDIRAYLQASNAFALTSDKEGLGISVLEAMATGLPCLVTNSGGPGEIIQHGVQGLVVKPGDVAEVAAGIKFLATRPEDRIRMGEKARVRVSEAFNAEKQVAEIYRIVLN